MKLLAKRIVLDANNPLFRKVHPVVLHIFCCGVQAAETKRLMHNELLNLFLNVLVLATVGGFLRWVCTGYLSGAVFRQKFLTVEPMETLVGSMVAVIPNRYRDRYDEIMDLYLDSNKPGNEERLNRILEEYSQ